jgi:hypothetical protein
MVCCHHTIYMVIMSSNWFPRVLGLVLSATLGVAATLTVQSVGTELITEWASPGDQQLMNPGVDPLVVMGPAIGPADGLVLTGPVTTTLQPGPGLSDIGGVASGWKLDRSLVTSDVLDRLGDFLGVEPAKCVDGQRCISGEGDDNMQIGADDLAIFSAYLGSNAPKTCAEGDEGCTARQRSGLPSEPSVVSRSQQLLRAAGFDPRLFSWDSFVEGHTVRGVATLQLGGTELPLRWIIDYSSKGIYSVNGFLSQPDEIDGYTVVGAATAARRTSDARWSGLGAVPQYDPPMERTERQPVGVDFGDLVENWYPDTKDPKRHNGRPVLDSGSNTVVVTSGELSLFFYRSAGGGVVLFPAWLLRSEEGTGWYVPALSEEYVLFNG